LVERAVGVGQQRQEPWPHRADPERPTPVHRLADVCDTGGQVAQLCGGPPVRCVFSRGFWLATQLRELRGEQQRNADAVGMLELAGMGHGLFHRKARVTRISEHRVRERIQIAADDSGFWL
jgi:hypothetical protein